MAVVKKLACIPNHQIGNAPILSLFFIWRLHGKPRHGYSLIKDLREIAIPTCKPSTVYSLLTKLERRGLVKSHLEDIQGRARRLYQTTAKGWGIFQAVKKTKMKGLWREFIRGLLY